MGNRGRVRHSVQASVHIFSMIMDSRGRVHENTRILDAEALDGLYSARMGLQIFGTKKCPDTRKAERFFKDRGVSYQFIDLAEKGISAGELASVIRAVGREALIDTTSPRARKHGLAHMDYDPEEEILKDPLLMRTPVVRNGNRAVIGANPEGWMGILGK
jgi:arsenate reductase